MLKKYTILINIIFTSLTFSMQQIGLKKATQNLTAISPQLTESTRQISLLDKNFKDRFHKEIRKGFGNPVLDAKMSDELYKKYHNFKNIPPIYRASSKTMPAAFLDLRRMDPISYSLMKEVYPEQFILYNPEELQDATMYSLLHEIGHSQYKPGRLAYHVKNGIRLSFIIGIFFKMIALKYGILGFAIAPKLFWNMYLRFFEEPYADDFAIKYANIDELKGFKKYFEELNEKIIKPIKIIEPLLDPEHPRISSRINKIQRAIDGHPNYTRIIRIAILFTVTEEVIRLLYMYSTDETSIKYGLQKLNEIENNFEAYCDKLAIPAEGRPIYKYGLEMIKRYWLIKLYLIESGRTAADIKEEEIIEIINTPNETIIKEEKPIKERWKHLFPE